VKHYENNYTLSHLDPNMTYLNRLDDFGLIETIDITEERRMLHEDINMPIIYIGDDFFQISLTTYGSEIITNVLNNQMDLLSILVNDLVSYELTGNKYQIFHRSDGIDLLILNIQKFPEITGDQVNVISDILKAVKNNRTSTIILRSIPPTIERILKNILSERRIISFFSRTIGIGLSF